MPSSRLALAVMLALPVILPRPARADTRLEMMRALMFTDSLDGAVGLHGGGVPAGHPIEATPAASSKTAGPVAGSDAPPVAARAVRAHAADRAAPSRRPVAKSHPALVHAPSKDRRTAKPAVAAKSSCGEAPSAAAAELAALRKKLATRDAEIAALRAEIASSRAAATVQLIPVAKTPERTAPQERPAAIVVDASRLNREALQAVSTGDYRAAVAKFRRAAELDDAAAMANLGTMYLNGTGVSQDAHQALQLLVKAANKGNRTAAENLGTLCEYGISGVAQNPVRAYQWYEVAARLGSTTVQTSMARIRGN